MSDPQVQQYIDIINKAMREAQGQHAAAGLTLLSDIENLFCADYPQAKSLLITVAGLVAWWPQYGAVASALLKGLLALADELHQAGCPNE